MRMRTAGMVVLSMAATAVAGAAELPDAELVRLLTAREFAKADAWIGAMSVPQQRELTELLADDVYERLEADPDGLAIIEGWVQHSPESAIARAAHGFFFIKHAWKARGGGYADTVTQEGAALFKERMLVAQASLDHARKLDPASPGIPADLINIAAGLGLNREYVERQYQRAIAIDPHHYRAHILKWQYLLPRWYGAPGEAMAFAREAYQRAPKGSRLRIILARSHFSNYTGKAATAHLQQPAVWAEVQGPMEEYLAASPGDLDARNRYIEMAYTAGHKDIARRELMVIGDNWDRDIWKTRAYFEKVKAQLMQWD